MTAPDATPEVRTADTFLRIRGGPGRYDLMTWPNPDDPAEVEWRLRFARMLGLEITSGDRMIAASVMHAYQALIEMPQRERNQRISQIRAAKEALP